LLSRFPVLQLVAFEFSLTNDGALGQSISQN
jgi:hypothetical protein